MPKIEGNVYVKQQFFDDTAIASQGKNKIHTEYGAFNNMGYIAKEMYRYDKTTFIKLLCRLYDVSEGRILIDGVDIKDYSIEEYRSSLP